MNEENGDPSQKSPEVSPANDDTSSSGGDNQSARTSDSSDGTTSDTFTAHSMFLVTEEDFNGEIDDVFVDDKELKQFCVTRMSPEVRKLLRFFGDSISAAKILTYAGQSCRDQNRCAQVLPLPPLRDVFPNTSRFGLYAIRNIRRGSFIAPCPVLLTTPGECGRECGVMRKNHILYEGLQNDFFHYDVIVSSESRKRKRNSDQYLQRKRQRFESSDKKHAYEPDPKYYSDDEEEAPKVYDKYDICIDLSDSTDELKAIRRNCLPNCVIRYVILHQRMEMFIMARRDILAGEEMTLPHDYDSNLSNKVIQCAHPYSPTSLCLHEKERQDTIRNYVKAAHDNDRPSTSSSSS